MKDLSIKALYNEDIITADVDTSLQKLEQLMEDFIIGHIPITHNNVLVGIVSKLDILKTYWEMRACSEDFPNEAFLHKKAGDIMNKNVTSIKNNATVRQAIDILTDKSFHSLPVVDKNNKPIGILTSNDLLLHLMNFYND